MKKDEIQEKAEQTPKKLSDLRKNALSLAGVQDDEDDQTLQGFMIIGDN